MKTKMLSLAVAVAAFASNAFGQGQVLLANNASSLITNVNDGLPVPVGSLSFQLYYGPAGTPEFSLMPVGPVVGTSAVSAGRIANTVIDIPTAVVPAGSPATFQIWVWSSRFASYAEAANSGDIFSGNAKSGLFNANTSLNIQPPPLPTSLAGLYFPIIVSIPPIPEPSTFALAGLGIAALALYRRRR